MPIEKQEKKKIENKTIVSNFTLKRTYKPDRIPIDITAANTITSDGILQLDFSEALKRPEDIKFYNMSIAKINEDPWKMLNITYFPNKEAYAEDIT